MIADVPLCTLLSGGLDSSVLTALAQRIRGSSSPVRSFSVDFGGADASASDGSTDDGPFVKEVVDHLGVAHTRATLDPTLLASSSTRTSCVRARDLPLGIGDLDMSLYLLSKNVGLRSKVAISGEAADEVFGGYRWFHDPQSIGADTFPWMATPPLMAICIGGSSAIFARICWSVSGSKSMSQINTGRLSPRSPP